MNLDNYSCSGQLTTDDYLQRQQAEYKERYPIFDIGKKFKAEEGWRDDWHYAKFEKPEADDIYCGIVVRSYLRKTGFDRIEEAATYDREETYDYTYVLWIGSRSEWYTFDTWRKKWIPIGGFNFVLAWMLVPSFFLHRDEGLQRRYEALGDFMK